MKTQMKSHLPANFRRIRLELAREPGHPEGDAHIGYWLTAPLTSDGRLDPTAAHAFPDACVVVRFGAGEDDTHGLLHRRPGGSWSFHYDRETGADEDPGYRLGAHRFAVGEYVTIEENEGAHTYRVASVQSL